MEQLPARDSMNLSASDVEDPPRALGQSRSFRQPNPVIEMTNVTSTAVQKAAEEVKQKQEAAQKVEKVEAAKLQEEPQTNSNLAKWRTLSMVSIILTSVVSIVFLQVLMFIRNCLPMSSGILLRRELSIAYFVASIFFLLILRAMYFATDFAHKQLLKCLAYFAFVLGILLVFGGIIVLVLELPMVAASVVQSWASMSQNQKIFFTNLTSQLQKQREINTILVGAFLVVQGVLFVAIGVFLFMMHRYHADWVPESKTRGLPKSDLYQEQTQFQGKGWVTCNQDSDNHFKTLQVKIEEVQKNQKLIDEKNQKIEDFEKQNLIGNMRQTMRDFAREASQRKSEGIQGFGLDQMLRR